MEFQGLYKIPAPPDEVWDALHDPAMLHASIPGSDEVRKLDENAFQTRTTVKIGPIKARFDGKVTLIGHTPPPGAKHACTLKGEGQGGAAGFARGEAEVVLASDGDGTVLTYKAQATIGGRLAQMGQRMLDATAKSMADEFFARFARELGAHHHEEASVPASHTDHPLAKARAQEGLAPQIWLVGLVGIVIILLIVFGVVLTP
jgi:carbon monoxide dehydrogenase subunit G